MATRADRVPGAASAPARTARIGGCAGFESDAELNGDLPAADSDLIHNKTHQLLAVVEIELVDAGGGAIGKVADSPGELVISNELVTLRMSRAP